MPFMHQPKAKVERGKVAVSTASASSSSSSPSSSPSLKYTVNPNLRTSTAKTIFLSPENRNSALQKLIRPTLDKEKSNYGNNLDQRRINQPQHSSTTETVPSPRAGTTPSHSPTPSKRMEHSYIRDSNVRPLSDATSGGLAPARTILVRRPPQCPSCHTHPLEEHELDDGNQATIPGYNEISAKESMNECSRIAKYVKNANSENENWEARINQMGWTNVQKSLFEKVTRILDDDQLGRLANANRQHEPMHRRVLVDKSAARMRKLLASVAWDSRMTQWLHCLLMDSLPATYMASYLDILQTLKTKVPILMDKMLFGRPLNISQELLAPVMKKKWEPQFTVKNHKLQQNAVIVALPSMPTSGAIPSRLQKWYQQLASITQIVQITLPMINNHTNQQPLEQVAEQIISLTRVKIQELRNENPMRSIILIGFNAGAALALQVAMSEAVACVVCMGFAYNTIKGVRGTPEDRILDLKVPILFVVGQNSARTSQEEMESLREKMQSDTSLVIVGSADDYLRVPKSRRRIENVTQSMVDAMVVDEVYEFVKRILTNPPGPRVPLAVTGTPLQKTTTVRPILAAGEKPVTPVSRKRKQDGTIEPEVPNQKPKFLATSESTQETEFKKPKAAKKPPKKAIDPNQPKRKVGRPRTRPLPVAVPNSLKINKQTGGNKVSPGNDELNQAMQTLLGDSGTDPEDSLTEPTPTQPPPQPKSVTNYELVSPTKSALMTTKSSNPATLSGTKIKMIPSNQFLQIKPQPIQTQSKIYTIKTTPPTAGTTTLFPASASQTPGSIGSIVRTTPTTFNASGGQQQIFTLKSPNGKTTQFVTAGPGTAQQKYTVVKNAAGGQMLQLTTAKNVAAVAAASASTDDSLAGGAGGDAAGSSGASRMDLSIIDMPILFADNDGNLTDTATTEDNNKTQQLVVNKPNTSSGVGQLIISQKIIKEANTSPSHTIGTTKGGAYVISKPRETILTSGQHLHGINSATATATTSFLNKSATTTTPPSSKVVFINRNTMKPCPNIISRSNLAQSFPKYAKVVVSNSRPLATTLTARQGGIPMAAHHHGPSSSSSLSSPSSIVSNVKQLNLQALKSVAGSQGGSTQHTRSNIGGNIISLSGKPVQIISKTTSVSGANATSNAIGSDKPTILRNIVVKPGNLKQIPAHLTNQLLNRNLTVRKLVNFAPGNGIVPSSASASATSSSSPNSVETTTSQTPPSSSNSSSMQTTPKIITLNPVNTANNSNSKAD